MELTISLLDKKKKEGLYFYPASVPACLVWVLDTGIDIDDTHSVTASFSLSRGHASSYEEVISVF